MKHATTQRYYVSPQAAAALHRDGLGWGHDIPTGTFHAACATPAPLLTRVLATLGRRAV